MQTRSALERNTERFAGWARRGQGLDVYPHLVRLEPQFEPFPGYWSAPETIIDDARRPTLLSRAWERLISPRRLDSPAVAKEAASRVRETEPPDEPIELEICIPSEQKIDAQLLAALYRSLSFLTDPLSFELIGQAGLVSVRLACAEQNASAVTAQVKTYVPLASIGPANRALIGMWRSCEAPLVAGAEFGLEREFMVPIRDAGAGADVLTTLIGTLSEASSQELAVVQVLFVPAREAWAVHGLNAVTSSDGKPFFIDAPEVTRLAQEKLQHPLFAVAVRCLINVTSEHRAAAMLSGVTAAFQSPRRDLNSLVAVPPDDLEDFQCNVMLRCTNRPGMLLSLAELCALARLPGQDIRSENLVRTNVRRKLPELVLGDGIVLGEGEHDGIRTSVRLPVEARLSHTYVVGASGTGKSTLLSQMILQDIEAGHGVAVIDPHGDLIDDVLGRIPDERVDDVILFDPADTDYVVGWNLLGAHSEVERDMLASDLVAVWKRMSTSWGDQMTAVLGNAVLAFLDSSVGGTLTDLRKFLLDDDFRKAFLGTVRDDHIRSFWREEFPLLIGRKPQAPILTRLDMLLRSRFVREALTESDKPLDFRAIMDGRKILLARLAQGAIGEENAALLGSMVVSKLHQTALSRQEISHAEREPFFVYVDEFQDTATPSMAALFAGVRKYKLAMCVAHQDLFQLHAVAPELERSVLSNVHTRVVFRVSEEDSRKLERGLGEFRETDLLNLGRGEAVCRVGSASNSFRLWTAMAAESPVGSSATRIRERSGTRYGKKRGSGQPAAVGKSAPQQESLQGRGSREHRYLQRLIKRVAEQRGFEVKLEQRVLDGLGHVDALLVRGGLSVACEISVGTSVQHELDNLTKSLSAQVGDVVLVSARTEFLEAVEREALRDFAPELMSRLHFLSGADVAGFLDALPASDSSKPVRGPKQVVLESNLSADPEALLDVHQTSTYVRRAVQTLAKLRSVGGGPAYLKIGKNIFYQRRELDNWLAARKKYHTD